MAPFKLKFRMGSSRSTSQEHDPDPQVNEALLTHHQHHGTAIGASSSTIDSTDCNSLGSMGTNERKSLLPNKGNNLRLGYLNQSLSHSKNESLLGSVPTTPPPSYEHVLEENTRMANNSFDFHTGTQLTAEQQQTQQHQEQQLQLRSAYESPCDDPDCQENYRNNECHGDVSDTDGGECDGNCGDNDSTISNGHRKSIDSTELLISTTNMTAPSSQENLLDDEYASDCQQCADAGGECNCSCSNNGNSANGFCDPLMNRNDYYNQDHSQQQSGQTEYMERRSDAGSEDAWEMSSRHSQQQQQQQYEQQQQQYEQQQQQQQQQYEQQQQQQMSERTMTPEVISNKSSKEIYKDLARQWGITCKMSDGCRCMECQSHYFDCEFDDNEHQKTDGGLGAGTPMFISEVMHGSACTIL